MNSSFDLSSGDIVGAVTAMEPSEFYIAAGFLAFFSLVSFIGAFRYFRRARMIEDVPTSKVRSASQGYVELEGHAMPAASRGMQTSPLSGNPCLWWDFKVEQRRKSGKNNKWVTIDKGTSKVAFLLDDKTGHALIKPAGATTSISMSRTWYGSSAKPTPVSTSSSGGFMSGPSMGSYRYSERVIVAGEHLYALGNFETEREDGLEENVLRDPKDGRPFLIATKSQDRLTAGLKSNAGSSFAASLASGAGLMWLLAARGLFE